MQNVAVTSNKRSMKNDQNPATAHHTITTARRPDNIRSSILVRGRSIRSMARSGRQPRRPLPRKIHIFAILAGLAPVYLAPLKKPSILARWHRARIPTEQPAFHVRGLSSSSRFVQRKQISQSQQTHLPSLKFCCRTTESHH